MYLIWVDMPFCVSNYAWGIILSDYSHKKDECYLLLNFCVNKELKTQNFKVTFWKEWKCY